MSPLALTIKPLKFKICTDNYRLIQLRSVSVRGIESKECYLTEIISFISEQVPLETDKIYGRVSAAGINILVSLIETIKG